MLRNAHAPSRSSTQSGFSLIYVIMVLVAISTLAAAMATFTGMGTMSQLNENAIAQARYIAMAGYNYVKQFGEDYDDLAGKTFTFGNIGQFQITDTFWELFPSTALRVRVVGTVNAGTAREANYVIHNTFMTETPRAITFREDFDDFGGAGGDPITSNQPVVVKNSDKTFTVGNNVNFSFGAMYYTGSKSLNWGKTTCTKGRCDFGPGFRMFFVSKYTKNDADGLVFTWFNDILNFIDGATAADAKYAVGGSSELGEMMGYAGDGRVYAGSNFTYGTGAIKEWVVPELNSGIQPPKMGVEFDNWRNAGTSAVCGSSTAQPSVGNRRDHASGADVAGPGHIAYVFWGAGSPGTSLDCAYWWKSGQPYTDGTISATWAGAYSFDDNRHGDGLNSANTATDGYWKTNFAWLNKPFAFRLEVERNESTGTYTLTSWIRQCDVSGSPTCNEYFKYDPDNPTNDKIYFSDTSRFLCNGTSGFTSGKCSVTNPHILKRSVTLTAAQHAAFEKMIFGFTTATGGATQIATFSEFILQFIKANDYDNSGLKRRVIDKTIN